MADQAVTDSELERLMDDGKDILRLVATLRAGRAELETIRGAAADAVAAMTRAAKHPGADYRELGYVLSNAICNEPSGTWWTADSQAAYHALRALVATQEAGE